MQDLDYIATQYERLRPILFEAKRVVSILSAIDEFEDSRTPAEDEDRPPFEHRSLLIAHGDFFRTIRSSLLRDAHMQVAKLLIANKDSLHVRRALEFARTRDKQIQRQRSSADFSVEPGDFGWYYQGVSPKKLKEITSAISDSEHLLIKLELVRNRRLGHEDKRSDEPNMLSLSELGSLIVLSESTLEAISETYGGRRDYMPKPSEYWESDYSASTRFLLGKLYTTY